MGSEGVAAASLALTLTSKLPPSGYGQMVTVLEMVPVAHVSPEFIPETTVVPEHVVTVPPAAAGCDEGAVVRLGA